MTIRNLLANWDQISPEVDSEGYTFDDLQRQVVSATVELEVARQEYTSLTSNDAFDISTTPTILKNAAGQTLDDLSLEIRLKEQALENAIHRRDALGAEINMEEPTQKTSARKL